MNGTITFDFYPFEKSPEQTYLRDDGTNIVWMHPPKYDPYAVVTMIVRQDFAFFTDTKITMSQEEFIGMVRALNNEKNKLLKWRRMNDAEHGERV